MSTSKANKKLAKFIGTMLGRAPWEFGLVPDESGYVKIREFLKALNEEPVWRHVREAMLNEVLMTVPGAPFEISGGYIRATDRERLTEPVACSHPPALLYVCVRGKAYPHALEKGIAPSFADDVVLADDREMAEKIGRRRDAAPVTLTVQTATATADGVVFRQAGEGLFLADFVPPGCFTGPALPRERYERKSVPAEKPQKQPPKGTQNRAGTFTPALESSTGRADKKKTGKKKDPDWKKDRKRIRREKQKGSWP
ncbi:MAG: hypothetical protein SWH61_06220 [Thermodesulfobacteriota bacterium]|nr:hypothetical protein [Thermodesulfobacteriota bacterium]